MVHRTLRVTILEVNTKTSARFFVHTSYMGKVSGQTTNIIKTYEGLSEFRAELLPTWPA